MKAPPETRRVFSFKNHKQVIDSHRYRFVVVLLKGALANLCRCQYNIAAAPEASADGGLRE
jgi:hypothetical protein